MNTVKIKEELTKRSISRARTRAGKMKHDGQLDEKYKDTGLIFVGIHAEGGVLLKHPKKEEYHTIPKGSPTIQPGDEEIRTTTLANHKYDDRLFVPMKTNTTIDGCFSTEGGIYPATNTLVVGDPGIGKSTITMEVLDKVRTVDPSKRVLFISGEMNRTDLYGYCQRNPGFKTMEILFMSDYFEQDPRTVIESILKQGWDLVVLDSIKTISDSLKEVGLSYKRAEHWLLKEILKQNDGFNERNLYTAFLLIQQVNKGGTFVGSMGLSHNTTAHIEFRFNDDETYRFVKVVKNRRGFKFPRLQFSIDKGVSYRDDLVKTAEQRAAMTVLELQELERSERLFNESFLKLQQQS